MKTLTVRLVHGASELAVVEILSQTLDTTIIALMAAHPYLFCEPPPRWRPPPRSNLVAQQVVRLAHKMQDELADYQRAVDLELELERNGKIPDDSDDIPF